MVSIPSVGVVLNWRNEINISGLYPVTTQMVNENFRRIKTEVADIIENEIERILNTPGLEIIRK